MRSTAPRLIACRAACRLAARFARVGPKREEDIKGCQAVAARRLLVGARAHTRSSRLCPGGPRPRLHSIARDNSLAIDPALRQLGEFFVRSFFFLQGVLEQLCDVAVACLAGPCDQGPVR